MSGGPPGGPDLAMEAKVGSGGGTIYGNNLRQSGPDHGSRSWSGGPSMATTCGKADRTMAAIDGPGGT